jgi:hypothetical protein
LQKKSGKHCGRIERRTDRQTDGQTGIKPIVPSCYTGKALKTAVPAIETENGLFVRLVLAVRQFLSYLAAVNIKLPVTGLQI